MKRAVLTSLLVLMTIVLAGCNTFGNGTDNSLPPSPLVNFQQTLQAKLLWSTNVGNGAGGFYLRLIPAAQNQVIYAASRDGVITAVNAQTGQTLWSVKLKQPISSGVATGGGAVYVTNNQAQLLALSQRNGQLLWQSSLDNEALAPPLYTQGKVLVHTIAGSLAAYSAQSGKRIWRFDQSVPSLVLHAAGQPQIAGNRVVAGFANGELVVLSLSTGRLLWEQHVAFPSGNNPVSQMIDITVNPVVVNGIVYAATYQGQIAAYSVDNGQLIWQHKISSYAGIAANQSTVFVSDASSHIWAFDENSGAVDWKQSQLSGRKITGPALYHGAVVVADGFGYLHFLSQGSGAFVARVDLGQGALAQPIVYQGRLYVMTAKGNLIAVAAGA